MHLESSEDMHMNMFIQVPGDPAIRSNAQLSATKGKYIECFTGH